VKHWEFVAQIYVIKHAQKVASHSGDRHQLAGTLRARGDNEQTATQKAGPSGLLVQGTIIDKPAEEDTAVQQLRTAEIKQFVAAKKKRNKIVFSGKIEILFWY
jgi:Mg-chelatase subunit ChlD